jgi:hypothetical protein
VKLSQLIDPNYQAILRKLSSQEIPLKTAFKLRGIVQNINAEVAKYEEVRTEALKRYGDKKEDGSLATDEKGTVGLSGENRDHFINELNALLLTDVSVGSIAPEELGDKASLTTQELIVLGDLITS